MKFDLLIKMLEGNPENIEEKKRYIEPYLLKMENEINSFKSQFGYIEPTIPSIRWEPDVDAMRRKLDMVQDNPSVGIREKIQTSVQNLIKWASEREFGSVDFSISECGTCLVTMHPRVHKSRVYGSDETTDERFNRHLQWLQKKGFSLIPSRVAKDLLFENTVNNQALIIAELETIGATAIDFVIKCWGQQNQRIISEVSFRLTLNSLASIEPIVMTKSGLNKDDYQAVIQELKLFENAKSDALRFDGLRDVCIANMIGSLAFICRTFDMHTTTSDAYFDANKSEREANQQYREMQEAVSRHANLDNAKDIICDKTRIMTETFENMGLFFNKFSLNMWGTATFNVAVSHVMEISKSLNSYKSFRDGEEYLIDTMQNIEYIQNLFLSQVVSVESIFVEGQRCIKSINLQCNNFI